MKRSLQARARARIGAAIGALLLATIAGAQTLPVPPLPPVAVETELGGAPPGTPGAPPTGAPGMDALERPRPRAWEYAIGGGVGWDTNVDFLVPKGPRALAVFPRGGVARVFSGRHAELRAVATGSWTGYPDERDLGRYQAECAVDGFFRPSAATTWRASASQGWGHSDSSRILLEQGVSLPVVRMRTSAAAVALRKGGTGRLLRLEARFRRAEFDSPALIDGDSVRVTLGLERRFGRRDTAAIEYSLENVFSDQQGRSYRTHFASVQWSRLLSPRSALLLEAGASYTPDAARAALEREEGFFGGASFSRQVGPSRLMAFVRREVTPAFGLGVSRLELRAGLAATVPLGRHWEVRVESSYVHPDATPGREQVYGPSEDAFAAVTRRWGRGLEASAEARYRRRTGTTSGPDVQAFTVGLHLTLLSPSGRGIAPAPGR